MITHFNMTTDSSNSSAAMNSTWSATTRVASRYQMGFIFSLVLLCVTAYFAAAYAWFFHHHRKRCHSYVSRKLHMSNVICLVEISALLFHATWLFSITALVHIRREKLSETMCLADWFVKFTMAMVHRSLIITLLGIRFENVCQERFRGGDVGCFSTTNQRAPAASSSAKRWAFNRKFVIAFAWCIALAQVASTVTSLLVTEHSVCMNPWPILSVHQVNIALSSSIQMLRIYMLIATLIVFSRFRWETRQQRGSTFGRLNRVFKQFTVSISLSVFADVSFFVIQCMPRLGFNQAFLYYTIALVNYLAALISFVEYQSRLLPFKLPQQRSSSVRPVNHIRVQ